MNEEINLKLSDVYYAQKVLKDVVVKTPLIKSKYLSEKYNSNIFLKLENMQLANAFKFRGAYNKIASLSKEEKENGIIVCSSGNHAIASSLAAKMLNVDIEVYMPVCAASNKVKATRDNNAKVILIGESFDDAREECEKELLNSNKTYVPPFNDLKIIAGQATIALELFDELNEIDSVIAPIGGGGLISGLSFCIKQINPEIKVIGVEATNIQGMKESIKQGKIVEHFIDNTIADGCAVKKPGDLTYSIASRYLDQIITIEEDKIKEAIKEALLKDKILIEGASALCIAALEKVSNEIAGKNIVLIISGGNIDSDILKQYL